MASLLEHRARSAGGMILTGRILKYVGGRVGDFAISPLSTTDPTYADLELNLR